MTTPVCPSYAGYRFPAEIISHAVWLYFRFPLSLRMVEEMLAARGIIVSHETVRQWARKFGQEFANRIRRRLPCGWGQMASRRGRDQDRRQEALAVARGGPERHRARHPGAEPAGQTGRQAAAPQAAEAAMPAAARHDHRQAGQLWGGKEGDHARR